MYLQSIKESRHLRGRKRGGKKKDAKELLPRLRLTGKKKGKRGLAMTISIYYQGKKGGPITPLILTEGEKRRGGAEHRMGST